MVIPALVKREFRLGSKPRVTAISIGLIHQTYRINSTEGTLILQRLHPVLAGQDIAADFLAVTEHLKAKAFPAPVCRRSVSGDVLVHANGSVWRAQTFLSGVTHTKVTTPAMADEAAAIYARFHLAMNDFPNRFRAKKLLHDTPKVLRIFEKIMKQHTKSQLMPEVSRDVDLVRCKLRAHLLPDDLPLRVIHGDPKISNVLFDRRLRATGIVDLDTCNRRPLLVELGDAFRSWCGKAEDDPHNTFSLPVFNAAWRGYAQEARGFITARERKLVAKAIGTITLELAARFLIDYFEDSYFGWDSSRYLSRRAHNLARARGQIAEFRDYQKKLPEIVKIIASGSGLDF